MGKVTGFKEFARETAPRRPVAERIHDWKEVYAPFPPEKIQTQAARCMDCGVPFCHTGEGPIGCPVNNLIPDWNDLVYKGRWREAARQLHSTNNFPEFTGRICPAPCEASCVLGINEPPVTIKQIEKTIAERAFAEGWVVPEPPKHRTGKRVAIVGSGPAGLAAAQQLNREGHTVVVFEKADKPGGLLRYGIPEFKLEKRYIDRRLAQLTEEGVEFRCNVNAGVDVPASLLRAEFDAILIATGAEAGRDLNVPGRELDGVHFAMDYLPQANRRAVGEAANETPILATGKHTIIIGGGDTGADCLGTAIRQGCASVTMFEIDPEPPPDKGENPTWPVWPRLKRIESAHEEWSPDPRQYWMKSTKLVGDDSGHVRRIEGTRWNTEEPFSMPADLVLLAMGFTGPVRGGLLEQLGVAQIAHRDSWRIADSNYATSVPGVFAAGDARRGQSLVVWAIREGREAAAAVQSYLSQAQSAAA